MKKPTIILFFLLTNIFCFGQTYSDIISDREIISFLTWEVNSTEGYSEEPLLSFKRKISRNIAKWDSLNFIKPDSLSEFDFSVTFFYLFQKKNELDAIFSDEDKQYLFEQFQSCKNSTWENKIPKATITSRKNKKRLENYQGAIEDFEKAIKTKGGEMIYMNKVENSFIETGFEFDVAMEEIRFERGIARYNIDSLNLAFEDFNFCLEKNFERSASFYWRGIIYVAYGMNTEGCSDLNEAQKLGDPDAQKMIDKYCK